MKSFWTYYVICLAYSFYMSSRTWRKEGTVGGLGTSPEMDSLAILFLSWVLAPVDLAIRLFRVILKAESVSIVKRNIWLKSN
jgi:hypothetical protein